jgi:hypothetical protein
MFTNDLQNQLSEEMAVSKKSLLKRTVPDFLGHHIDNHQPGTGSLKLDILRFLFRIEL